MITKIKAVLTALIIAISGILLLFRPAVPEALTVDELALYEGIIAPCELADRVYIVESRNTKAEEEDTLICLQGLVNREKPQLYIINGSVYRSYIEEICQSSGIETVRTDSDGNEWTLTSLIRQFKGYITDNGYVLYRNSKFAEGLNTACNYATVEGWLAVPVELKSLVENCGLTVKADISENNYDYDFLKLFFNKYKENFKKGVIVHEKSEMKGLRDLAVQQGFYITYSESNTEGEKYLGRILKWSGGNSYILGWTEEEKRFVKKISSYGCAVIPSDHSRNNSYLASYLVDIPEQTGAGVPLMPDSTKHYVALVFSDGDNSQWIQNGFREYYTKINSYDTFPISWTFPIIQPELCSVSSLKAYRTAGTNNYFIAGVSGSGYMNPSSFNIKYLDKYTTETASMMLKNNMRVVTILDNKPNIIKTKAFEQNFDYFSRFDNIDGGIVMLDPDRYSFGKGKIWFTNNKPFVSVRLSLWYPGGESAEVSKEWIEEQADIVNSYIPAPTSIDGYTVVNVHPWTITVENLAYFVSLLDENVKLVTADQLINLITENVPHVNALPKQ